MKKGAVIALCMRQGSAERRRDIRRLQLERAPLKKANELLGKDLGIDRQLLTNPKKTHLVDALRPTHTLTELLHKVGLPHSSYFYHRARPPVRGGPPASCRRCNHASCKRRSTRFRRTRHWSTRTLTAHLGVGATTVRKAWHNNGLKPHLIRSFKLSNDQHFARTSWWTWSACT